MVYQLFHRSILILVLLSLYCYASPVPSDDQNQSEQATFSETENHEQSEIMESSDTNTEKPSTNELNEIYYLRMLCALYGSCNDGDEHMIDYEDIKRKRLSSNLYHGVPKFGKRAFSSAFAGIPKFG